MGDREVPQREVGLARRHIVVGVVLAGHEVRGAHRLAQVAEAQAGTRIEELAQIASRSGEGASRRAEESVIEAPSPSMRWSARVGSTAIVGADGSGAPSAADGCSASRLVWSPVVSQARGAGP